MPNLIKTLSKMAVSTRVTRSTTRTLVSKKDINTNELKTTSLKVEKVVKVKKPAKTKTPPPSPSKKASVPKIEFEDSLAHIFVPKDLSLPKDFESYHSPQFIEGVKHILKIDPTLYRVIVVKNFPSYAVSAVTNAEKVKSNSEADVLQSYWYSLISGIISQQVSGAAALAIEKKFNLLFGPPDTKNATPQKVLKKSHDELRGAGLSHKKVEYVQNISEHFINPETNNLARLSFYEESTDEEVAEEMIKLKGIGPWSVKMFMTFTLNRMNVFAHDDLGVARGSYRYLSRRKHLLEQIKKEVKEDEALTKLLSRKSKFSVSKGKRDWVPYHDVYIGKLGEMFDPYKSIMMLLLWRMSSTCLEVLEGGSNKNEN